MKSEKIPGGAKVTTSRQEMDGGAKDAKKGPVDSVRIVVAGNGYTVSCSYAPANPGMAFYVGREQESVFTDKEKLLAHVATLLPDKKG